MIDLRSDTVTLPNHDMLQSILNANFGDDSRRDTHGNGGDPTVRKLERMVAELTNKEDAVFFPSGTLANTTAMYAYTDREKNVLLNESMHIYASEKAAFSKRGGGIIPEFYSITGDKKPDVLDIEKKLKEKPVSSICIENTHNYLGGICLTQEETKEIYLLAKKYGTILYMDGARIFNAAIALDVKISDLTEYVDSLMICFSKGIGAPMGAALCGENKWIQDCRRIKKLLGGNMRQAGVIAAPAIYALEHNIDRIKDDHENAKLFAKIIKENSNEIKVINQVETNIVLLDIAKTNLTVEEFLLKAERVGVLVHKIPNFIRATFHLGISKEKAIEAANLLVKINDGVV